MARGRGGCEARKEQTREPRYRVELKNNTTLEPTKMRARIKWH